MSDRQGPNLVMSRLLGVKRSVDRRLPTADQAALVEAMTCDSAGGRCIACGYELRTAGDDRCPECGLAFAALYEDPTPWSQSGGGLAGWLETVWAICSWNRRLRVRASMVPAAVASRRFAACCVGGAATAVGIATAVMRRGLTLPGPGEWPAALAEMLMGSTLAGACLLAVLVVVRYALCGRWRHRQFIPASVHYACAWWLLGAIAFALLVIGRASTNAPEMQVTCIAVPVLLLLCWCLWLWDSVVASARLALVGPRVMATAVLGSLVIVFLLASAATGVRATLAQSFAAVDAGLTSAGLLQPAEPLMPVGDPRTFVIVIDAVSSADEGLIDKCLTRLGAVKRTMLIRDRCTGDNIRAAFRSAVDELQPWDRLVLYLNAHGSNYGYGSVAVCDGLLSGWELAEFLAKLKAVDRLVIIESCYGGNFLRALQESDAVVVAATDEQNVAFLTGLRPFWRAWLSCDADMDRDGAVTPVEAFAFARQTIIDESEDRRLWNLAWVVSGIRHIPNAERQERLLREEARVVPQFRQFGRARQDVFAIRLPLSPQVVPSRLERS